MLVKKTTLLTVNNVSKSVQPTGKEKRLVLNEINLRLYDNEVVSILGQSGSGKSTLLRILSGLIAPDLGTVMLGDKKVSGPNPQINMVFQTFAIFPWLNVYQNIAFGLQAQDLPPQVVEAQTLKMLDLVGLTPYRDAYPRELSGGMRQRVGFARTGGRTDAAVAGRALFRAGRLYRRTPAQRSAAYLEHAPNQNPLHRAGHPQRRGGGDDV